MLQALGQNLAPHLSSNLCGMRTTFSWYRLIFTPTQGFLGLNCLRVPCKKWRHPFLHCFSSWAAPAAYPQGYCSYVDPTSRQTCLISCYPSETFISWWWWTVLLFAPLICAIRASRLRCLSDRWLGASEMACMSLLARTGYHRHFQLHREQAMSHQPSLGSTSRPQSALGSDAAPHHP